MCVVCLLSFVDFNKIFYPKKNYLNSEVIPVVDSDKHLGNYISTNITHRNIIDIICDLYQRSNSVISDFRVCDSNALDSLHRTYCMHMYGCELWDLNCNYIKDFKVAWRKIKRRIWRLPSTMQLYIN